jgi:hypothetical protein
MLLLGKVVVELLGGGGGAYPVIGGCWMELFHML